MSNALLTRCAAFFSLRVCVVLNLTQHLRFTTLQAAVMFALAITSVAGLAAEPMRTLPKAEECIDVARLNSVSEAERAVLRVEWRAGLARAEESRLLNEMYERIERMQRTTYDIRVLMNAIPSPGERAASLNSPSGLGPSAVIPPVVATPVSLSRKPAAVVDATAASATTSTSTTTAVALPDTAATVSLTPLAVARDVTLDAPSSLPPQAAPIRTPRPAPTFVDDAPDSSPFAFKSVSNFDLAGGGLVFVALVVLWWLRRRSDVGAPTDSTADAAASPKGTSEKKGASTDSIPANADVIPQVPAMSFSAPPLTSPPTQPSPQVSPVVSPQQSNINFPLGQVGTPLSTLPQPPLQQAVTAVMPLSSASDHAGLTSAASEQPVETAVANSEIDFPLEPSSTAMADATATPQATTPLVISSPDPTSGLAQPVAVAHAPVQSEESILELAEMMLAMGLATGAAQKLVDHIRDNPKKALAHWLKLLEIYRESGQRSKFEQAAKQLQKEFNIRASDWMRGSVDRPRLEKFDRVYTKTEELWTQPAQCIAFLSGILADNRDGTRVGFPQEVAEEILLLIEVLKDTSGVSDA